MEFDRERRRNSFIMQNASSEIQDLKITEKMPLEPQVLIPLAQEELLKYLIQIS